LWRSQSVGITADIDIYSNNYSQVNSMNNLYVKPVAAVASPSSGLSGSSIRYIPTNTNTATNTTTNTTTMTTGLVTNTNTTTTRWQPLSASRRLHHLRRILFNQTKTEFFESVLDATTTPTPLHQDEYEDPREIPTISINRVKATPAKLSVLSNMVDRVKQSLFGQIKDATKKWSDASYRRSYLGM
jgi:hypothetical protein